MSIEEMQKENQWHTNFVELAEAVRKCAIDKEVKWSWARNWDCKYINIWLDMRDGGYILTDRTGKRIDVAGLLQQEVPDEQ